LKDTAYHYSTGNINDKKLRSEILRTSFKLSDNESKKLQAWLQTDVTVDLENVHMMISNRQIKNMAEIAGFKNTKTGEKVEKQDFSDWRQIVKMVQ
jgi:predicted HNH restriction endonuclease